MKDTNSMSECMAQDGATIPTVPGKGLKVPGMLGAELSNKKADKEAGKFEDMMQHATPPPKPAPKPQISNTTPSGGLPRKGGAFNPEIRPGGNFQKRSSAMQRNGVFEPQKKEATGGTHYRMFGAPHEQAFAAHANLKARGELTGGKFTPSDAKPKLTSASEASKLPTVDRSK